MAKQDILTPKKADMHDIGKATIQENIEYRERLDNVSATAATADNVLNVATDPRKMLGLLMLIGLIVLLVWMLKKPLQGAFGWLGSIFGRLKAKNDAQSETDKYADPNRTDKSQMNYDKAKEVADNIYSAFGWFDDDEQVIYGQLGWVQGDNDWALVKQAWGGTRHFSRFITGNKSYTLEGALGGYLSEAERQICRNTLRGNGVTMPLGF